MHASRDDVRQYPLQIARLASDPLLCDLGLPAERIAAFVASELAALDPFSAQVARAEVRWRELIHSAVQVPAPVSHE